MDESDEAVAGMAARRVALATIAGLCVAWGTGAQVRRAQSMLKEARSVVRARSVDPLSMELINSAQRITRARLANITTVEWRALWDADPGLENWWAANEPLVVVLAMLAGPVPRTPRAAWL